jgi:hypothetical protein
MGADLLVRYTEQVSAVPRLWATALRNTVAERQPRELSLKYPT